MTDSPFSLSHTQLMLITQRFCSFPAIFQLDKPVSAGSRGLANFLKGISDELRQTHRSQLFKVEAPALRSAASQLLQHQSQGGRVILGPQNSADWPREQTDQDPSWERIVFTD